MGNEELRLVFQKAYDKLTYENRVWDSERTTYLLKIEFFHKFNEYPDQKPEQKRTNIDLIAFSDQIERLGELIDQNNSAKFSIQKKAMSHGIHLSATPEDFN